MKALALNEPKQFGRVGQSDRGLGRVEDRPGFNIIHGRGGKDGVLQLGIPYTGASWRLL
jgi:hypothetical protein